METAPVLDEQLKESGGLGPARPNQTGHLEQTERLTAS